MKLILEGEPQEILDYCKNFLYDSIQEVSRMKHKALEACCKAETMARNCEVTLAEIKEIVKGWGK